MKTMFLAQVVLAQCLTVVWTESRHDLFGTLYEKMDIARSAIDEFSSVMRNEIQSFSEQDTTVTPHPKNFYPTVVTAVEKLRETLNDGEKIWSLSKFITFHKEVLPSLQTSLSNLVKQLTSEETIVIGRPIFNDRAESFIELLDTFRRELVQVKKQAYNEVLAINCANEIKHQCFDLAWQTFQRIHDFTWMRYIIKTINGDLVLQFAEAVSDAYTALLVCRELHHKMTATGIKDPMLLLRLMNYIRKEIINRPNITASVQSEAEGFVCMLLNDVTENVNVMLYENEESIRNPVLLAEEAVKLLTFDSKTFGMDKSTWKYRLEQLVNQLPFSAKVLVFGSASYLMRSRRRFWRQGTYICANDNEVFPSEQVDDNPTKNCSFYWKLKRLPSGKYNIINVCSNKVLSWKLGGPNQYHIFMISKDQDSTNVTNVWRIEGYPRIYITTFGGNKNLYLDEKNGNLYFSENRENSSWEILECI